jgi:O-antigen/teichoic acid export membrane protein
MIALVSHLTAERPYRAGLAPRHAGRLAAFATPLMLNGLLLFLGSQGDRLLIGKQVGLTELGHFSAAMLLIFYPAAVLQRFLSAIHLPLIAADAPAGDRVQTTALLGGQATLIGILMIVGYALVAPAAVPILFGSVFTQPTGLLVLIGCLQTFRFVRLWPITAALAIGRSGLVLCSNMLRLLAFPIAFALHRHVTLVSDNPLSFTAL